MATNRLTNLQVKQANSRDKDYKITDDAKEKLLKNIDPSLDKKQEKLRQQLAVANTFEAISRKIEQRNALDVVKRVPQDVRRIFAYAVELGHIEVNPARELTSKARQPLIEMPYLPSNYLNF